MSLKFEPLEPSRNTLPWNQTQAVLEQICGNLSVPDLCEFSLVSRECKRAAYNEGLWMERLRNLDLADCTKPSPNSLSPLDAIDSFGYSSGSAREGFMRLYKTLSPLYNDLVSRGQQHSEPLIFRAYRDPIDQARVLGQIQRFAGADPLETNHEEKLGQLNATVDLFENAALGEFEQGYDEHDIERVEQYAKVLITLNGGDSCVQLFVQKNPLLYYERPPEQADTYFKLDGTIDWGLFDGYLQNVAQLLTKESKDIDTVFGTDLPVFVPLFERVLEDNIMELVSSIIEKSRENNRRYLRTVPEIYQRLRWFRSLLKPSINSGEELLPKVQELINENYGLHVDQYLAQELQTFVDEAEEEVGRWSQRVVQNEQAQENLLWSNVTKAQDKSDFLSSFKKVLLMPVSAMNSSSTSVNHPPPTPTNPSTPKLDGGQPTTELDAMVAVMNSKLEGINTLFSLELALGIIRSGRDAIERIAKLTPVTGSTGRFAREQCEQIFVELVRIVGSIHVKGGFDRALATLNAYDPRQHRKMVTSREEGGEERNAVEPLAIFAELVNIGDLIQQMIHVFFEEELAMRKFIDRNDFLSPSVKAKKRFEQTLDDSVANGLNRGIDVLVDQIDFTFVTLQLGSDYNPGAAGFAMTDIGPTEAAKKVVSLLQSHVSLLAGSTEKSVIDVFQQEIGVRFFGSISKHLKRQTVSVDGAIKLISDLNYYYNFISSLKQRQIMPYFEALKEVGQLFLIDGSEAQELGKALSDMSRFRGVLQPEELLEFVRCRADWLLVRREVERAIYGLGIDCTMM